jgi:hypothetical protein
VAAIILAGVLAYLPALRGGFVWDDEPLITANPLMRTPSGLAEIWSGSRTADYFPVTNTVFWIEHHLFGDNATGYHAVNILLQAANALLLWRVLRRLQIPGAFLAGAHLRHPPDQCRIGGLDFGAKKRALNVLFSNIGSAFL